MPTVDQVTGTHADNVRELALRERRLALGTVLDGTESVEWGNPVFEYWGRGGRYLLGHKSYLRFGFFGQGVRLTDSGCSLKGTGKATRHVKVRTGREIRPICHDWLQQAAAMIDDRQVDGYRKTFRIATLLHRGAVNMESC